MRRLLALAAVLGIAVLAIPAGAEPPPPDPEVDDHALGAPGEVAAAGFVEELEITDDEVGLVGLKWDGDEHVEFRVLVQGADGTWEELDDVEPADNGPDPGTEEDLRARAHRGADFVTEPLGVTDPSRVRVEVLEGTPSNVELVTVTEPEVPSDRALGAEGAAEASALARTVLIVTLGGAAVALFLPANRRRLSTTASLLVVVMAVGTLAAACKAPEVPTTMPSIVTRSQWGANSSWNCSSQTSNPRLQQAVIHHTATPNNDPSAPAARLRSIQAFHVQTNGWCDIGYNFLISPNGTIYEGRARSITGTPVGAHAIGFNSGSFGVAVLGDYNKAAPTNSSVDAIVRLITWKFTNHGVNPYAGVHRSYGGGWWGDSIIGHRDANPTSCPGTHLYNRMTEIRNRTKPSVSTDPFGNIDSVTAVSGNRVRIGGWAIDPLKSSHINVHIYVGGLPGTGTGVYFGPASRSRPDVAQHYPGHRSRGFEVVVPRHGPDRVVCVYADGGSGRTPLIGCRGF